MSETNAHGRQWTKQDMEARLVRYGELRPCLNAFIDTRTPGSESKENFTIIGPGVSENPDQFVHIAEPHGFNIGAARQPPGCVNSQHSHDTAEVFVVHSGSWRFDLGETGEDAQIELAPGDVISIPTRIFRGFTNVGAESGLLWAVLGNDDPGRVTWAPHVFEMARDYGLLLLDSGRLVDVAAGESIPEGAQPMAPTTEQDVLKLKRVTPDEARNFAWKAGPATETEQLLIGENAHFSWPHGFTLSRLVPQPDTPRAYPSTDPKVLFVHQGTIVLSWDGGSLVLGPGDTLSLPDGVAHSLTAMDEPAIAYMVRRAA